MLSAEGERVPFGRTLKVSRSDPEMNTVCAPGVGSADTGAWDNCRSCSEVMDSSAPARTPDASYLSHSAGS